MRSLFFILVLVISCSEQDANDPMFAKEDRAIALASAKCGSFSKMPWLRAVIRQAETEFDYKGDIYAIQYSGGVVFLYQRWISSCWGCLTFDCDGNQLVLTGNAMNDIIGGATEDNIIYSSF